MKIYISGKITGDEDYEDKFWLAEAALVGKGHLVMNPAILPPGFVWDDYMTVALAMQSVCDATLFLPDWNDSRGAKLEHFHATEKAHRHKRYYSPDEVPNV